MKIIERVRRFIEENQLLTESCKVVVGVSGGADSIALLKILCELGFECMAVHCNFHLRGRESDRDEAFVRTFCTTGNIPLIVCNYDTEAYAAAHKCSIEMAARELRYSDFERLMHEHGYDAIAVAHHRDDSVETVLMNLIRGTGIRGLRGISPKNGNVIRPLLCLTRAEIEGWLESRGQTFVTDSTNLQNDYTRNKIRNQLLPLIRQINPDADNSIHQTSEWIREASLIYDKAISDGISRTVTEEADGEKRIDLNTLSESASPESLLFEILFPYGYTESQIKDIISSIGNESGRRFQTSGATLIKDRNTLILRPNSPDSGQIPFEKLEVQDGASAALPDGRSVSLRIRPNDGSLIRDSRIALLDADKLQTELTVRRWRNGDSFVPFGMRGRKLVSDFMTDAKMTLFQKDAQIVVCSGDDIVWIAGRRIDNRYRIGNDTVRIAVLEIEDTYITNSKEHDY